MNPVTLGVVLRVDTLAKLTPVPLVPFAEADFGYTFLRIGKGNSRTAVFEGEFAEGGSPTWQVGVGILLQTEKLSKKSAQVLREQFGIDGAELSFGFIRLDASSLGKGPKLAVGGTTWLAGLALKF